jgi:Lrp/AsnC family transcriptional regulator for asnA, asnC and gidA
MKVDELNLQIVRHLREGRKSFKKIAEELNITENTVRSRVTRMLDSGLVDIAGRVSTSDLPGHQLIMVGINLSTHALVETAEDFTRLRGVISARLVTGRYDVILEVMVNEEFRLVQFLSKELEKIKGIQSVETFVVYEGYNDKVPYVL